MRILRENQATFNVDRESREAKRQRLDRLYRAISETSPAWARMKPWEVEKILEGGERARTQGTIFSEGAGA